MKNKNGEESLGRAAQIALLLDDKKAEEVMVINVSHLSNIGDCFVVATAQNKVHARALSSFIEDELVNKGETLLRREGEGGWAVLDYGSIIIHIFEHSLREFYHLEKLWNDGKNIFNLSDIKKHLGKQQKEKDIRSLKTQNMMVKANHDKNRKSKPLEKGM